MVFSVLKMYFPDYFLLLLPIMFSSKIMISSQDHSSPIAFLNAKCWQLNVIPLHVCHVASLRERLFHFSPYAVQYIRKEQREIFYATYVSIHLTDEELKLHMREGAGSLAFRTRYRTYFRL